MKIKPEVYALELKRKLGIQKALRIATNLMNNTDGNNWMNLPKGSVFYKKNKYGVSDLDSRGLTKTHNFWFNVFHILNKNKY